MIEELRRLYRQKTGADIFDSLTELHNHGFFHLYVDACVERAKRLHGAVSIALINIEFFSNYNTREGFAEGDRLLREIAKRLKETIRHGDAACRYLGDHFSVLFDNADREVAQQAVDRIKGKLIHHFGDTISLSIGLATYPHDGASTSRLFDGATKALQEAGIRGQNKTIAFQRIAEEAKDDSPNVLIADDDERNIKLR